MEGCRAVPRWMADGDTEDAFGYVATDVTALAGCLRLM